MLVGKSGEDLRGKDSSWTHEARSVSIIVLSQKERRLDVHVELRVVIISDKPPC